jgi:SAM-dependent methyltransferase
MPEKKREWFEDESFWDNYAPIMFDPARWAEAEAVADGVCRLSGAKAPADTLDLCCGMGRISVELARRGFRVTGVDITPSYLEAAREATELEGLSVEYVESDARKFSRPAAFDLALNLYISWGYFEDPADDRLVARRVLESLRPGGTFIIETLGQEIAQRDFTPGERFERGGFEVETQFYPVNSWGGLHNRWTLRRDGKVFEREYVQRLYSAQGLTRLLLEAGFSSTRCFGEWDASPYNESARVLICMATK